MEVERTCDSRQLTVKDAHLNEEAPAVREMQTISPQSADMAHEHKIPLELLEKKHAFLCALEPLNTQVYNPQVVGGIHVNEVLVEDAVVALWSEKSANKSGT
ncbi:hypothetical protein ABG768_005285, partial [Culter alburnus]